MVTLESLFGQVLLDTIRVEHCWLSLNRGCWFLGKLLMIKFRRLRGFKHQPNALGFNFVKIVVSNVKLEFERLVERCNKLKPKRGVDWLPAGDGF